MQNLVRSVNQKLKQSLNKSINEIFGETKSLLLRKQPPNLLRLFSPYIKNPQLPYGLLTFNYKDCNLCALNIKIFTNFRT